MLTRLSALVTQRFGLTPRQEWSDELARAVNDLAHEHSVPPTLLVRTLERESDLLRDLAGRVTIDESYFLRQPEHFELAVAVLAKHLASQRALRPFTFWSAGCSRGEEPYTFAMLVADRLPAARGCVRILGSDLSREAIHSAQRGWYSDWSLRILPDELRDRYFKRSGNGWELDPGVRSNVAFRQLAITEHLASLPEASVDMVFFRNVAIYLEPSVLEGFYLGFARVLAPGGHLVIGASDPVPERTAFREVGGGRPKVYARVHSGALAVTAPVETDLRALTPASAASQSFARPSPAPPSVSASLRWLRPRRTAQANAELYRRALALGDEGNIAAALDSAGQLISKAGDWNMGYMLRGMLRLAMAEHREAVDDLRRAVFLAPEDVLPRYLYATALRAAGVTHQARAEVEEVARRLRAMPASAVLEDGHTTAAGLLAAALELIDEREPCAGES